MIDAKQSQAMIGKQFVGRSSRVVAITNLVLLFFNILNLNIFAVTYQFSFLELVVFSLFVVSLLLLPGGLAVSALSLPEMSGKSRFVLANALGLAGLCYFSWLLNAKFKLPYYSGTYLLTTLSFIFLLQILVRRGISALPFRRLWERMARLFQSVELTVALLLALLAVLASNGFVKNPLVQDGSFCFWGTTGMEGIWHLGNVAYMKKDFDFGDIHQNGFKYVYHFFIYIFVALASNLCEVSTVTVFFKFLPIYLFFFLSYSCYVAGSLIFGSRWIGIIASFLALFMDDAAFAIKLGQILHSSWLEYLHLGPKITSTFFNSPTFTAALIIFFPLLVLLKNHAVSARLGHCADSTTVVAGFLAGSIVGFKTSTFLVLGLGLIIMAANEFLRQRRTFHLMTGIWALVVSLPFLIDLQQSPLASLSLNPAFFPLTSAMGRHLLRLVELPLFRWVLVFAILVIYLLIELGPRLLSLKYLPADWRLQSGGVNLVWLCGIIGVAITLLVTPSTDPYNAMYFHRFGSVCLAFLTGRTLMDLFKHKKQHTLLIATICLFYLAGGWYTFFRLRSEPSLRVPQDKIAGLQKLVSPRTNDFKTIISNRFHYAEGTANENIFYLYSAFSENQVLSEGERFSVIRFADSLALKRVRDDIALFYSTLDQQVARKILEKWSVDYVIVDLEYDQKLHFDAAFLQKVHDSENLIIYAFCREPA